MLDSSIWAFPFLRGLIGLGEGVYLTSFSCSFFRWKEVLRSTTHGSHTQIQLLVQHMPEVAKVLTPFSI